MKAQHRIGRRYRKHAGAGVRIPEYLRNIVQEVYRRWDRPMGSSSRPK